MSENFQQFIRGDFMNKKLFWLILSVSGFIVLFFVWNQNSGLAQIEVPKGIYLFGTIEKGDVLSGYFGKNQPDSNNKNWGVFVGENNKVYKLSLIGKSIHELYIDGQKIPDNEIWKHTAEYKSFLGKYWRNEEIEQESRELEQKIKPLDRRMEAINKEIEKLDQAEEKLDQAEEKSATNFVENRKSLQSQQQKLSAVQKELDEQLENLSKQQEKLSTEQESLNLIAELDKVLLRIGADLKSLSVIKDRKNLSFKLSNVELIVDGKKVSPEVFELLKARYIVELGGE